MKLPRHATVVAYVALFCALTAGAYAAVELPRNSVGTQQIKAGAVTSAKVADGSLAAADFAAGQLPTGEKGTAGPTGSAGKDPTLGTMPGGTALGMFTVKDSGKAACEFGSSQVPDGADKETGVAFAGLYGANLDGLEVTKDCTNDWGIVIPKTGVYTVSLHVLWNSDADGYRSIGLRRRVPSHVGYLGETRGPAANGTVTGQNVVYTGRFAKNDLVQVYAIQTSGAALGTISDPRTSLNIQYVAP